MTMGRQQFDESPQKSNEQEGSYNDPSVYLRYNRGPREQSGEQWRTPSEENNQGQEYAYSDSQKAGEKLTPRPQQKKSRFPTLWIGLAACLLVLFMAGGVFAHKQSSTSVATYVTPSRQDRIAIQKSYNVGSTSTLTVYSTDMPVSIHAANVDTVTVATNDSGTIKTVQNGDALTINQLASADNRNDEAISIVVPDKADINVVTIDASVDVQSTTGKLNISTINGPINIGTSTLQDSSTLKSTNGSISFGGTFAPNGKYQIESQNGDITIATFPGLPIHITASTVNGHIENPVDTDTSSNDPQAPDVQLHTVNGTIRVGRG